MKVCFVGIGSIAKRHIGNLKDICKEIGISLSIDALRRSLSQGDSTNALFDNVFISSKDLPADYDIIFLTNPTEYHVDMLFELNDKANHFFIEKPIASLNTVDKLKLFKKRDDAVYYVAGPLRYTRLIQYMKENLDPGSVRSIRSISSSYLPDWRPGIDYRQTYSAHKDLGGGVSIDLIHEWDYITYLLGMPTDVKSFIGKVSDLEIDSDDYAIYIARFADEIIAELHLDYFGRQSIRKIEILTQDDTLVGDFITGKLTYLKSGKEVNLHEERDSYQKRELSVFLNMVTGKVDNPFDIDHAIKVLKLSQGIIE